MERELANVLQTTGVSSARFEQGLEQLQTAGRGRFRRLWGYYANPMRVTQDQGGASDRPYRQAQEWGVPSRITGYRAGLDPLCDGTLSTSARKEVVIENDIAWRIDTQVDYLFGNPPMIHSLAPDPARRLAIETLLAAILDRNGGAQLLQQIALIGAVYGFADVAVTLDTSGDFGSAADSDTGNVDTARLVQIQVVEPARAVPLLDEQDVTRIVAYAQTYDVAADKVTGLFAGLLGIGRQTSRVVELWTPHGWWRWKDQELVATGGNTLGRVPVVHIQNTAMPFAYGGNSDVEPLIPLQDELNTRLSDRAHRIAMQSFRMYLGKNLEGFKANPPAPGRIWETTNPNAQIIELGGEASSASEQAHIADVREAIDKISGVPPVAAGAIRNRVGNLTSAAALRITLMSLLARTERKRALYGEGLCHICELALAWLDHAGLFITLPEERGVELHWHSPLPENDAEKLAEAKQKLDLGVGKEVVLKELGY